MCELITWFKSCPCMIQTCIHEITILSMMLSAHCNTLRHYILQCWNMRCYTDARDVHHLRYGRKNVSSKRRSTIWSASFKQVRMFVNIISNNINCSQNMSKYNISTYKTSSRSFRQAYSKHRASHPLTQTNPKKVPLFQRHTFNQTSIYMCVC